MSPIHVLYDQPGSFLDPASLSWLTISGEGGGKRVLRTHEPARLATR
jgi:hypothetical protein